MSTRAETPRGVARAGIPDLMMAADLQGETMTTPAVDAFDHSDLLNDDATVTFTIVPGNYHRFPVQPDTYSTADGDSWEESVIEHFREEEGNEELGYDDFTWEYDHGGIVRGLSEVLCEWISEQLMEAGLESLADTSVVDTWSPAYYNFTTDGFEMTLTCDPDELRALTEGFDVDAWAAENYASYDGFISWVPGRLTETKWRRIYDAEFRIEYLLVNNHDPDMPGWVDALLEAEHEVYGANVKVTRKVPDPEEGE